MNLSVNKFLDITDAFLYVDTLQ